MIRLPRLITPYADRDLDCQQALEDTFQQILHLAELSGWSKDESAAAIQELAFAHLCTEAENIKTEIAVLHSGVPPSYGCSAVLGSPRLA